LAATTTAARVVTQWLCGDRSVIVGGHGVAAVPSALDPYNLCVAPDRFRKQLELLLDAGFEFCTVAEIARKAANGSPPPGLAALSFDDGMENNVSVLLPILREYGVPATVYVTTGLMGRRNPWMHPRAAMRMMTLDEVREMAAAGIEIGAHTVTHPDLTTLSEEACRFEVQTSRDVLRREAGQSVETFAYPFFSVGTVPMRAVRDAGFAAAVTGFSHGSWAPLALSRAMITGIDGIPSFVAKLAGVYEPFFQATPVAGVRALSRRPRLTVRRLRERRRQAAARAQAQDPTGGRRRPQA
jgi:peptidoglycan/xylan/chitin deacetylase (PgdA/CDA1 family)